MPSSHFSQVVVLQSLPTGEMQTGKRLCEDIETLNLFHQRNLTVSFKDVPSRAEFLQCLGQLVQEATHGSWPLLHIECHGSDDKTGIVLADGAFLAWQELKPHLTTLNIATQCNLLVVLASCYGGHLAQIILPTERAPCWGLIGPTHEIFPDELMQSLSGFYNELFLSLHGDSSVKALLSAPLKTGGYYFTTAGGFFKLAYAKYFLNYCTPAELDRRAGAISRQLKKMKSAVRPGKGALKRLLNRTERPEYEKHFRHFFMIDLFPHNERRFSLSFAEVKEFQRALTNKDSVRRGT